MLTNLKSKRSQFLTDWHQTEVDAGVSILLSVTGSGLLESPLLAIRLFSFSFKHGAMGKQKLKTSNKSGATIISLYCRFTLSRVNSEKNTIF